MAEFIAGQRWVSDAELQLGLGTVLRVDVRSVMLVFLATGDTRTYAKHNAPLSRVEFGPGERIQSHEGWWLTVESVTSNKGLLTYSGKRDGGEVDTLAEADLANNIQLNKPQDRLLSGNVDASKWFELRVAARHHQQQLVKSKTFGLVGPRTDLLPHQLYIAHDVASRFAPRVLLADEVGLGKTIEAGQVLHQQLLTQRAQRALIVVPETLAHQWLVEMLRRFNLHVSFYDEERCKAVTESEDVENPFSSDQLVLCTREFFCNNPTRLNQAKQAGWDLLITDEAHHLHWSPEESNLEYQVIEQLANASKGLILLTGTPEQAGASSHFARLRLLDPARFPSLEQFEQEQNEYVPLAQTVEQLMSGHALDKNATALISRTIDEGDNADLLDCLLDASSSADQQSNARERLVEHLLDRHGTSRVLFRNTRNSVKGFPERKMHAYPLALPSEYQVSIRDVRDTHLTEPQALLSLEILHQRFGVNRTPWTEFDPRVEWLVQLLKRLRNEKILVIAAHAQTALDLETLLRHKRGLRVAVFHEGLNIVERDRAAVYFAQPDDGAQALICSEIGSEGRNFQFAHHLVLFDLPWNPDLLEQRIGRLDRIGQTETIQIHIPYLEKSAHAILFRWYHEGLCAFERFCPAGASVFNKMRSSLLQSIHQTEVADVELNDLIGTTRAITEQISQILHDGRDRLLEFQSCRPRIANQIVESIATQDNDEELEQFLDRVFDCYGIDVEDHGAKSFVVRPAEHLQASQIPGLPNDGMTITYDRKTALANDPYQFMTWEHPLVQNAMEMLVTNEKGNSCIIAVTQSPFKAGTVLLEALFVLEANAEPGLQISRYLPATPIRVLLDKNEKNISTQYTHEQINAGAKAVDPNIAVKIARAQASELRQMIKAAREHAQKPVEEHIAQSKNRIQDVFGSEIERLTALKRINPNVRPEEIEYYRHQLDGLTRAAEDAGLRLDALRVVIAT